MNSFKVIFLLVSFLTMDLTSVAQKEAINCERLVQKNKVAKAISCYEDFLKANPKNVKALCRLTELSYAQKDFADTKKYATLAANVNAEEAYNPLYYLARKMSFKRDNTLAVFVLDLLANRVSSPQKKEKVTALKSSYLLKKYELEQPHYNVALHNLGDSINTLDAEYLPSLSLDGNTMVFTRRVNGANEDFFITHKDSMGQWQEAQNLGYPPNTGFPDGAAKLSADGNYLFFTRCDMRSPNGLERGGCDLVFCFKSGIKNGQIIWSAPQYFKFTINTVSYEGQPCLSSDNKDLYFVSDRAGGFGGKDIYVSHFENNVWTKPENLGPTINTAKDETTPFIHPDNETLYFASDGHPTLGRADIFMCRKNGAYRWKKAINLGAPINTENTDGGIAVSARGDKAYVGTARAGSHGKLDIYTFELYEGIKPKPTLCLKGKLFNKKTGDLFKDYSINFYDLATNNLVASTTTNKGDASYTQALHRDKEYMLVVQKTGYRTFYKRLNMRIDSLPDNVVQPIRLRQPGVIDTLGTYRLALDSNQQLTAAAKIQLEEIENSIPGWLEDSAQIKLYMRTHYYIGDHDTDRSGYIEFDKRLTLSNKLRNTLLTQKQDQHKSILRISPYLWRDEEEAFRFIELKFVEFY